jgi:hypothetical protein
MYKQVAHFLDYCNHMLCTISAILQVGMLAHFSSINFYTRNERKYQQNLKCHNTDGNTNGNGVQMELECKWNSNLE